MSTHETLHLICALLGFGTAALRVYLVRIQLQLLRLEIQRQQLQARRD